MVVSVLSPLLQSPLRQFAELLAQYFAEIWDFLIFIGTVSGVIVVLVGVILWFRDTNPGSGESLVFSGILLSIVVQCFVMFPPHPPASHLVDSPSLKQAI